MAPSAIFSGVLLFEATGPLYHQMSHDLFNPTRTGGVGDGSGRPVTRRAVMPWPEAGRGVERLPPPGRRRQWAALSTGSTLFGIPGETGLCPQMLTLSGLRSPMSPQESLVMPPFMYSNANPLGVIG